MALYCSDAQTLTDTARVSHTNHMNFRLVFQWADKDTMAAVAPCKLVILERSG